MRTVVVCRRRDGCVSDRRMSGMASGLRSRRGRADVK